MRQFRRATCITSAIAATLAFAATPALAQQSPARASSAEAGHVSTVPCGFDQALDRGEILETRNGTEMVGIYSCWRADEDNDRSNDLTDFYAHWSVRELSLKEALPRAYDRESNSPVVRLFVGRDLSVVGSLRIDLHDPDTTFVVPLASFAYQGLVGKGQNWSTNLVSDDQSLGFFRLSPTSSARITVTAKSTSALQVQAASTILGVLRDLSSIAAPGGALVTSLNRDSIQQTSKTLDNALSSIWGQSQEESHTSARQLSEWYPGARFIVQLTIPRFVKVRHSAKDAPETLTRWYELSLSCPRRSIFSSLVECSGRTPKSASAVLSALAGRISAPQVLNVKVAGGTTLQQFISDHDWYSRFLRIGDTEPGNGEQRTAAVALAPVPVAPVQEDDSEETTGGSPPLLGGSPPPLGSSPDAVALGPPPAPPVAPVTQTGPATKTVRTESDYAALCSSIVNALYSIGFSRLDSQIGLWAIVSGSSDFVGIQGKFQSNPRCTSLLPQTGLDGPSPWAFAILPDDAYPPPPVRIIRMRTRYVRKPRH